MATTGWVGATRDGALLDYVRAAAQHASTVGSTSTDSLILAAAGLLEGKRATTHRAYAGYLSAYGACYVCEHVVASGKIINPAGVSAGIDMAF